MRHPGYPRRPLTTCARRGALVTAVFALLACAAPARAADPVEELRNALPIQLGEDRNPEALRHREETLQKRITALRTLSELRRALALTEWKDTAGPASKVRDIDRRMRGLVAARFQKGVEAAAAGSPVARLAAARMLGEMGMSVRALDGLAGFVRSLTPVLVKLTQDPDPSVRAAAARALGKTNPLPDPAVAALTQLLRSALVEDRRAAAEALLSMVQVIAQLQKKGRAQTGVEANEQDVIETSKEVVPGAGIGVRDPDVLVRRMSLQAIRQAATTFGELIPEPYAPSDFPPPGRPWTKGEQDDRTFKARYVSKRIQIFEPLILALASQGEALAATLSDPDVVVRLETREALEMIGNARQRLKRYQESVPTPPAVQAQAGPPPVVPVVVQVQGGAKEDPLGQALKPALMRLAAGVSDPNVRVRLAAVEFLETLQESAKPAVPALANALADPNRFVRWAAARTLARVGPVRTDLTVPNLARLLGDPDLDVAKQAAETLAGYGGAAKDALQAMIHATGVGDAEIRVAAISTLSALGPAVAAPSVPALIQALGYADARVRRAAADTLARFGEVARSAVPALERALYDEDNDVRRAASDALLSILPIGAAK